MIDSKELRSKNFEVVQNGYAPHQVDAIIGEAASTIDAYQKENEDIYHKMEVLANKIEEYRTEEDAIKTALVTAEKMAEKIKRESNETASQLLTTSEATAKETVEKAQAEADNIVSSSREYAKSLIEEKTNEANSIISDAEKKANDAITSAKVVAQNILDQAKQISEEITSKSKAEKEAYEILTKTIKEDAKDFIENLKSMYNEQLEALSSANLNTSSNKEEKVNEQVADIKEETVNVVEEIEEVKESVPETASAEPEEKSNITFDDIEEIKDVEEIPDEETAPAEDVQEGNVESSEDTVSQKAVIEEVEEEEEADPMAAIEAFSRKEVSPISASVSTIPEIDEEPAMENASRKDEDSSDLPFENFFNVKREDVHNDRSQTISLVPPEEDEEDDQPKFKGFFKHKK